MYLKWTLCLLYIAHCIVVGHACSKVCAHPLCAIQATRPGRFIDPEPMLGECGTWVMLLWVGAFDIYHLLKVGHTNTHYSVV
ncbi:ORF023L [giant sea perch iridovirus - K1]|uniref:ORF023L n=1 Tax=Giant seaperch iridovirus TaxID=176655 RepID=A0A140GB31_GSIV|nr:ORF023L [giant sea perch iridovirus - K1]